MLQKQKILFIIFPTSSGRKKYFLIFSGTATALNVAASASRDKSTFNNF